MDDVAVSLGKTLKVDAQLKVGDMTEVVQVQADARPAIDVAQHARRAQRHAPKKSTACRRAAASSRSR